ncbi:4Fe-4S binding protein [Eubacterium aggregans]|uniref:4Fe-4S binding protein n=1 Tax=Eubacterium aggregans TaxID=81409 RepID=UPI003F361EE2
MAYLKLPCKFSCPVNAITYDEYGVSVIDEARCIRCGACIHSCPFGAIGTLGQKPLCWMLLRH